MRRGTRISALSVCGGLAVVGCMVVSPLGEFDPGPSKGSGGGADGGSAGADGGADGGGGGTLAAESSGGASTNDTNASSGGSAGADGCRSNAQCTDDANGQPRRCTASGECVALNSGECPRVYNDAGVRADHPIYIGAFAPLVLADPDQSSLLYPFRLALEELSGDAHGGLLLPDGKGGQERRPLVMIACDNGAGSIDDAAQHLLENVGVSGILATLLPGDLRRVFEDYRDHDVFFLSPVGANDTLARLPDDDRVWTMLGQPKDLVPVYRDLVSDLVEPYLREVRGIGDRPLKVVALRGSDAFGLELSNLTEDALIWNDKPTNENDADGNYRAYTLDSETDLVEVVDELLDFVPDLLISTAGSEVTRAETGLIIQLEAQWAGFAGPPNEPAPPRPFYVLSPINAGASGDVMQVINSAREGGFDVDAAQRFIGVTAAGAENRDLQNDYALDLNAAFPKGSLNTDTGNYYDAFYYLSYAIYAAHERDPRGEAIARGMRRLLSGEPHQVGFLQIPGVLDALEGEDSSIELIGTLGPPTFDLEHGVRIDPGGIYCFQDSASVTDTVFHPDALRYERASGSFSGSFPCFDAFFP